MRTTTLSLVLCLAFALLSGCALTPAPISCDYGYKGPKPSVASGGGKVLLRAVAGPLLAVDAGLVGTRKEHALLGKFTHPWGRQFKEQLGDSFTQAGFQVVWSATPLASREDVATLFDEARQAGARWVVIGHTDLVKAEWDPDSASNLGKGLIPIAGSFMDRTATTRLQTRDFFLVHDMSRGETVVSREDEESMEEGMRYQNTDMLRKAVQQRIDLFTRAQNTMIGRFWGDSRTSDALAPTNVAVAQ